jgi:hypothetical protein
MAQQVLDNLDFIAKNTLCLRNIQIDDGYLPVWGTRLLRERPSAVTFTEC